MVKEATAALAIGKWHASIITRRVSHSRKSSSGAIRCWASQQWHPKSFFHRFFAGLHSRPRPLILMVACANAGAKASEYIETKGSE